MAMVLPEPGTLQYALLCGSSVSSLPPPRSVVQEVPGLVDSASPSPSVSILSKVEQHVPSLQEGPPEQLSFSPF
jgi:hypothetical protein